MAVATQCSDNEHLPRLVGPEGLSAWSRALREDVLRDAADYHERDLIMATAWRELAGERAREVRIAKCDARLFAEMPVRIREGERLVGWHPNTHADEDMLERIPEARASISIGKTGGASSPRATWPRTTRPPASRA